MLTELDFLQMLADAIAAENPGLSIHIYEETTGPCSVALDLPQGRVNLAVFDNYWQRSYVERSKTLFGRLFGCTEHRYESDYLPSINDPEFFPQLWAVLSGFGVHTPKDD